MKSLFFSLLLLAGMIFSANAQTTREAIFENIAQTGGVYYAYPVKEAISTPAPKGYKPFYISHFARHGSRWLTSEKDYKWVVDLFEKAHQAGALTDLGEDVRSRLTIIWKDAEGRGGSLTSLGVKQHRGIAERMFHNYPEVFEGAPDILARSTVVIRCVFSMEAFCERLKELNPRLNITREANERCMKYMSNHTPASANFVAVEKPWYEEYRKFEEEHLQPDRLVGALFGNKDFVRKRVNPKELMWKLYWIASDLQNVELGISLYDIFEKQELFDIWQIHNYENYVCNGPAPLNEGVIPASAKPLLKNILDSANDVIESGANTATLRFGHDGNISPLAGLMRLDGCWKEETDPDKFYQAWCNFKVTPMAANIQLIFFRKKGSDDILVKFLHCEKEVGIPVKTDIAPFYHWKDVAAYYSQILKDIK